MTLRTPASRVFGRRPWLWTLGVLAIVSAWATLVVGELEAPDILTQLGHRDYAQRQLAWRQLLADQDLTQKQIDHLYARTTSLEQRHRLLDVARHLLLRRIAEQVGADEKVAALGVGLAPVEHGQISGLEQGGCYVIKVYPGLPAFALLAAGDMILAIDGAKLTERSRGKEIDFFIDAIKARAPGDEIDIEVLRDGRTLHVKVKLASLAALRMLYDEQLLQRRLQFGNIVPPSNGIPLGSAYEKLWQQRKQEL